MKKNIIILSLLSTTFYWAQEKNKPNQEKQIQGITITKEKKAIEQKADRTIFDFSEQPQLTSGTLMEGIKKLPGMVVTDIAGMMYQGKMLDVYMDGRPLHISSTELNSFLEGMPANSVERIEVITNPGAEFPATSGGAILNIITNKNAKNYLTATYSGSYSFSNYDKYRSKTTNSINLSARNKLFGWQLSFGNNYRESVTWSDIQSYRTPRDIEDVNNLSNVYTDKIARGNFVNAATTFDIGEDKLILNYELNTNNNDNRNTSLEFNTIESGYNVKSINYRNAASVTYQKRFAEDKAKKLDFQLGYTNYRTDFNQNTVFGSLSNIGNTSNQDIYNFKVDFSQPIKLLDGGKVSVGGLYERLGFTTENRGITNLDYTRNTEAFYTEGQVNWKKMSFIAGARAENHEISGTTINDVIKSPLTVTKLQDFKLFKIFPNASVRYNFAKNIYLGVNYQKKLTLPSISLLNPNNNTLATNTIDYAGNPYLRPTLMDNYEIKFSIFDYAFISYSISDVKDQVVQQVGLKNTTSVNTNTNIPSLKIHSFNAGIPLPFMIFTKSIKEMMKFNFNPDKINFMYVYTSYQKHDIPNLDTKGFWVLGLMGQFILPKDIKLTSTYSLVSKGNYYYFEAMKPFYNSWDINITKKFMNDRLTVSLFADDILNGTKNIFQSTPPTAEYTSVLLKNKTDTRKFGISINYKIPTKNKLAKEDPNILKDSPKDSGNGDVIKPQ